MKTSKKFMLGCGLFVVAFSFSFYINETKTSALSKNVNGNKPKITHLSSLNSKSPSLGDLYLQTISNGGCTCSTTTCDGAGNGCSKNFFSNPSLMTVISGGNPVAISSYFSHNYASLSEAIPDEVIDGVIDQTVSTSLNRSSGGTASFDNVVFSDGSGILFVAQYLH